jgi:anti-sigma28 factor (negative regulator of flagellin synthesis)
MRIEPKVYVAPISSETAREPQGKRSRRNTGASVVSLSSAGSAVVSDADDAEPSARVQTLKMMVEQGTYHVDLETLASRIVDDDILRGKGT